MARTEDPRMTKQGKVRRFKASYLEKGLQVGMDVILQIPREHPDFKFLPKALLEGRLFRERRFIRARVASMRVWGDSFKVLGWPTEILRFTKDQHKILVIKCIAPHPHPEKEKF